MRTLRRALVLLAAFGLPIVFGVGAYMLSAGSLATGETLVGVSQQAIGKPRSGPDDGGARPSAAAEDAQRGTNHGPDQKDRSGSSDTTSTKEAGSGGGEPGSGPRGPGDPGDSGSGPEDSGSDGSGPDGSGSGESHSSGSGSDDSGSDDSGSDDSGSDDSGSDNSGSDNSGSGSSGSDGGGDD